MGALQTSSSWTHTWSRLTLPLPPRAALGARLHVWWARALCASATCTLSPESVTTPAVAQACAANCSTPAAPDAWNASPVGEAFYPLPSREGPLRLRPKMRSRRPRPRCRQSPASWEPPEALPAWPCPALVATGSPDATRPPEHGSSLCPHHPSRVSSLQTSPLGRTWSLGTGPALSLQDAPPRDPTCKPLCVSEVLSGTCVWGQNKHRVS